MKDQQSYMSVFIAYLTYSTFFLPSICPDMTKVVRAWPYGKFTGTGQP